MAIGTTNISLGNIYGEVNNTLPGGTNDSLKTLSQTAGNTGHTSTISGYTSPGGGLTGAPYGMGEFGGYVNTLPVVSNVQNHTGSTDAASFVRVLSSYNGFGTGLIEYQLVMKTTTSGSNYVATLYIEETSNGLGAYNGSAMSTGTLYPLQTVTFTQANWPDSYALDHSVVSGGAPGGAISTGTSLYAGTGETHTSGANWDNTTFTLLNPTTGTAFKVRHLTTAECWTGTAVYDDTITLKFFKSGYPTFTANTFTINSEQDMSHQGICP